MRDRSAARNERGQIPKPASARRYPVGTPAARAARIWSSAMVAGLGVQ